jgi:DNA-binding NtrC family response regulator
LTLQGLEVRSAGDGKAAVELGLHFQPRVLLCDWWLGGTEDGVGVAKTLSKAIDGLKVIFMTGHSRENLARLISGLEVSGIYQKPIQLSDLCTTIDALSNQEQGTG